MKKFIFSFLLALLAFVFIGCGNNVEETTKQPTPETPSISYDLTEKTLKVGETFVIEVNENVGFAVDNSKVISLDKSTKTVTALAEGEANVTIYLSDYPSVSIKVKFTVEAEEKTDTLVVTPTPTEPVTPTAPVVKEKYSITYDLDGGVCSSLVLEFEEDDFPQLPLPTKENNDFLGWFEGEVLVSSVSENRNYNLTAHWQAKEIMPESIEIVLSNEQDIYYTDSELKLSCVVYPEGASQEVTWKAINKSKATLNEDLSVNILHGNEATFKVTSVVDEDVSATVTIKIRAYINPTNFIESLAVNDVVAKKIRGYSSDAGYETYILGSVFTYLFEKISIIENMVPEGSYNRPGTTTSDGLRTFYPYFICVHDVGAPGDAKSNSNYCVNPGGTEVSWHFTVGNDGIYQQLPTNEIGWHAADGTGVAFTWDDTGIVAPIGDNSAPEITINQTNGKWMINGQETLLYAPRNSSGGIVASSKVPYTGINNKIDDDPTSPTYRHYFIGTTYYNTGYGIIANHGGNLNSIGIESTVIGNIFYTWELLAKLVGGNLLPNLSLTPRDIKQHNTFCGKNCPQTMRTAKMWETFVDYCTAEYIMVSQFFNFKIEFSTDSPYLKDNGMIKSLPDEETEVSYSIRFYSTSEGYDQTFNFTTKLPPKSVITY